MSSLAVHMHHGWKGGVDRREWCGLIRAIHAEANGARDKDKQFRIFHRRQCRFFPDHLTNFCRKRVEMKGEVGCRFLTSHFGQWLGPVGGRGSECESWIRLEEEMRR